MFPPRYHGTAFNVVYEPQTSGKEPPKSQRAHLITSLDTAELLSSDWRDTIHKFHPADVDHVENRKTAVFLVLKPGSHVTSMTLSTKPDPSDALHEALTQVLAIAKPKIRFLALTQLMATFSFPGRQKEMALHKGLMDATTQLIQSFAVAKGVTTPNGQLVDALTCVCRMRFRNAHAQHPDAARDAGLLFRRWFVAAWARAVARAARPADGGGAAYFARLAANAANTAVKAAAAVAIDADALSAAAAAYADAGAHAALEEAANRVAGEARAAIDADLARTPPCDLGHLAWALDVALVILAGVIAGMYAVDVEDLAEKAVAFTRAAVTRAPDAEELRKALLDAQALFIRNLLELLDGQRYDVKFQYVYAIWPLLRETPALGALIVD
jgi:hypothetical protein